MWRNNRKNTNIKTTATQLSIQTGVTADNPALLGALKINIKFEEEPYTVTVFEYTSGTGPVYDNNNTSNRYVHYIEMGEYPQTCYGTSLPKAESEYEITADYYYNTQGTPSNYSIIKPALYEDKITGQKFAKQGTNFYNVEPVRWIVIGVTDGVYSGGQHVLFTTVNKTNGLWLYDEATNTFKYRTTTSGEWQNASEVLVLSEYGLLRSTYKASGYDTSPYNHFSESDINEVLNSNTNANSLYNTMFTDNQKTKIIPTTMKTTSYYKGLNSTDYTSYNMFLLGSNINYSGGGWIDNATDSYSLGTYFKPSTDTTEDNRVATETAYSSGGTQNSASNLWLRSGYVDFTYFAMYLNSTGYLTGYTVYDSRALRPAFVLNLA